MILLYHTSHTVKGLLSIFSLHALLQNNSDAFCTEVTNTLFIDVLMPYAYK